MGSANLTYYIFEGVLVGNVAGEQIHILALSGGGGATTSRAGPGDPDAVNNPYRTGQKEGPHIRGGPIPVGRYVIKKPGLWKKSIAARLEPVDQKVFLAATGRSGFLIHGRGVLGSDGCIVPLVPKDFHSLMRGLERDDGGSLTVLESWGDARFA